MTLGLAVLLGVFAVAILMDVPVAFALGASAVAYICITDIAPLMIAAQRTVAGVDSFTLLAIPLFVLAGGMLTRSGLTDQIIRLCVAIVGQSTGGLATTLVIACMLFGALSGSAVADVVAIGTLMLPAMKERGYPPGFSSALLGCAGSLDTIIPPSIVMIVYCVATNSSIGRLFIAGFMPGMLAGGALIVVSYVMSRRNGWRGGQAFSWSELGKATFGATLALIAPVIIVGGIRSGAFTPTEAGGVAVLYTLIVGFFVTRTLTFADVWHELKAAADISAAILLVIATASVFSWALTVEQAPQLVVGWITSLTDSRIVVLFLLMALLFVLGTFMETIAIILILAPMLMQLFARYGIDPIHFGLLLTLNLAIGANTPPLGIDLMAACRVAGIPLADSFRYLAPFIAAMSAVLIILVFLPEISRVIGIPLF